MRLTLKLVMVFMLANIALAIIYGYLAVRREVNLFKTQAAAEAKEIGPLIANLLKDACRNEADRDVQELLVRIIDTEQQPLRVNWVWFDSKLDPRASPEDSIEQPSAIAVETEEPDGAYYLHVYWPVTLTTQRKGGLDFTHAETELEANKQDIIRRTALLVAGMLLISGLLAVLFGIRLIGRPLEKLIAKARRMGDGCLDGPVHLNSHDELSELAEDLNTMCAKLLESQNKLRQESAAKIAALEQLRHADRLKTVGRLASGIAHELGTPLNVVAGRAGLIGSGKLDAKQVAESAVAIKQEADKMTRIIRQLLDFARASTPHKSPVDLRTVVGQTIDLIDSIAEKQKVQLIFTPQAEEAVAQIDVGQIQQVLTNLTINAIQAMTNGGQVRFVIRRQMGRPPEGRSEEGSIGAPDGGAGSPSAFYAIEIHDQGVGIPEEHMQQLFEPFFTTKEVGSGTGLGLSIAYGIVQEHGGWIDVASRVGEGSCFTVYLPQGATS